MTTSKKETDKKDNITDFRSGSRFIIKALTLLEKHKFVLLIGFLAFWVKVTYISSIDMWDEGWFVAISSRISNGFSNLLLPLYYTGFNNELEFFDKPPVAFWGAAILMNFFGKTTFAAKGIIILGGTGLALIVYFLFSHQPENKSANVISGLLVALASFLTFYSRTAYIDPFVVFMGALVMLLAIRSIDAIFVENNKKKGYTLLIAFAIVNILNIMTKAWQGILTFPAIAFYLLFRYINRHIELKELKEIWNEIRSSFTFSKHKMNPDLIIRINDVKFEVPFPYIAAIFPFISSFLVSFLINGLFLSSIILAIITCFGFYIVFLKYCSTQDNQFYVPSMITGTISGFLAGIGGSLLVKIFYDRLAIPMTEIAQAIGEEDVFSGAFFEGFLSLFEPLFSNENIFLFGLELLAAIFGSIISFGLVFFVSGALFDIQTTQSRFLKVLYEGIDIIPLIIFGVWIIFWFVCILLMGLIFDRDSVKITLFGIIGSILLTSLIVLYPSVKNWMTRHLRVNGRIRLPKEVSLYKSNIIFLGIASILFILSFFPFVYWVQYLDSNIANGNFPWKVRVPGELFNDPQRPDPVTYTFLFFEYYISWRYSHNTSYRLPESIGGAINDYALLVILPFFVVGLFAFFFTTKRNPALGTLLIIWLITIPFVFFPAQFQLNYYYIPLAIPYFAIGAKGIEYIFSDGKIHLKVADNSERILAGGYFYIETFLLFILFPLATFIADTMNLIDGSLNVQQFSNQLNIVLYNLFVASIFLIPFTILAFRVLKSFPGIITTGFAYKFFLVSWIKGYSESDSGFYKLYSILFHNLFETILHLDFQWIDDVFEFGAPLVTFIGIILLIFGLYWLKEKIQYQALIILGLSLSAMLINVSVNSHYNQIFDLRFQEIAIYIKNHGGDYNYSTWTIPEAGASFAMRYYLGYEVVGTGNAPFSSNSTLGMESYYNFHNNIKFWVIINNSNHWNVPAYAIDYAPAYRWFTNHKHLVCVDNIVGLTSWYKLHFFVNHTWITEQGYDWTKLSG